MKRKKIIPKKPYNTSGYYVTRHAVKRMQEREISKGELGINLRRKPRYRTDTHFDKFGEPSYGRFSWNRIFAAINPFKKRVITVYRYNETTLRRKMKKENKNEKSK